jgi:1-deoxy-D-xylulose-5-phosphate reductoisomerase
MVLGCTGSIGKSTLDVARSLPEDFRVVGLACGRNAEELAAQAREFKPEAVAVAGLDEMPTATRGLEGRGVRLFTGAQAAVRMVEEIDADIVVNGISGASGLLPSFAALRSAKDLALANKESMVMAGPLLLAEAQSRGRRILPVDSEHAALFSLLSRLQAAEVAELIITASGGAFRDFSAVELAHVRFRDALRHPTWKMGAKITVDSASMANKGLEVIEAHRLFGIDTARIKVLIHPESRVHSLVRTVDGTLHAEISTPDMRTPIQNALTYPRVRGGAVDWLELAGGCLSFCRVDTDRFRMLGLAYRAATASPAHPIVFNAANELAVEWFMKDTLSFAAIPDVVEDALAREWTAPCDSVGEVLAVDAETRRVVCERMKGRIE